MPVETFGRIYAPEVGAYPTPRINRIGAEAAAAAAATAAPVSHVIPFLLTPAATARTARSAGPFKGPAIVTGIHFAKGGAAGGTEGILLGKASAPVSETGVANATARPWTPLFDGTLFGGGANSDTFGSDLSTDLQGSLLQDDSNLSITITDAQFHLVICTVATAAAANAMAGHVTLLEQVAPGAIANFL